MTREEAIKWLEYSKDNYEGLDYGAPRIAVGMAISALREQEERSKGCGHCLSEINKDMMMAHGFAHCADCGRRLEEV